VDQDTPDKIVKIFLNGRFLSQSITGVQRYAIELVKALDNLFDEVDPASAKYEPTLIAPHNVKEELQTKNIKLKKIGFLTGHVWEQLELPLYTRKGVLISICNAGPLLKRRQIVTIHDASVFGFAKAYSWLFRLWYSLLTRGLVKTAEKIVTVSDFSRLELMKYCGISEHKIHTIYEGKEHILTTRSDPTILVEHDLKDRGYILAVSSINPNKNFKSIVQAMDIIGDSCLDIVIAGGTNSKVFGSASIPASENIKYVGYVTDNELKALYQHAACFVYPSFYEGFGLPPLEAMACGCPVIVSNTSSLPEVCGDAALYCNPHDPNDIAEKIRLIVHDSDLREQMQRKVLQRSSLFTWERCAREFWSVIESVVSQ
jgi:glycosyltransferase involved in cell wall biosynthesis